MFLKLLIALVLLFPPSLALASASNEKELFVVAQRAFEDGFYDVSLRYVDQLFKEFPQNARQTEGHLLEGQCYFFKKEYLKAFAVFQELAKKSEYKDVVLFWLGETYLKVGDHVKAREQYRQLIDGYANSIYAPQSYYSLGWSYFEKADYEAARQAFLKVVELFPSSNLAEDSLFKAGECDYNAARYETAVVTFAKYQTTYPASARQAEAFFNIAESYYYLEQYEKAADFYGKARTAATDPRTALNAMIGCGWSFLKKGDMVAALKAFDDAQAHARVNKIPEDDILLGKASLFTAQEKYAEAAASYGEVIERFPGSGRVAESYLGRANAFYLSAAYPKAVTDYEKLVSLFSGNAAYQKTVEKAKFGLAWTYLKSGDIDRSIESFTDVVNTTESRTVKVSALTQIGDAYQEAGKTDQAIAAYDRILKEMPDTAYSDYVQYRLGVALLKAGQLDAAILSFQALAANYPGSKSLLESRYYLGAAYFKKKDWAAAADILEGFIKSGGAGEFASEARQLEALALFNARKYDRALKVFSEMKKIFPDKPLIQQNADLGIAKTTYEAGDTKAAMDMFRGLVARYAGSEASLEALLWMGAHAMTTGAYDKAVEYYTQALEATPQQAKSGFAHFELARAYLSQGAFEKAVEHYRAADLSGDAELSTKARLAIAEIFSRGMDPAKAIEVYRTIVQTSPDYKRDALVRIAQISRKTGLYNDEVKSYTDALAAPGGVSSVTDAQIQFLIGDAFEMAGRPNDAVEAYVKVAYVHARETPWVVKAYLRIGKIYENREEWDKAVTAYRKVADMPVDEAKFALERIAWIAANRDKK